MFFSSLKPHIPPYSSCLMFELYKSSVNDRYYIQLIYKNSLAENLTTIKLPGCDTKCSLEQLYDLYSEILVDDINECKLSDE